MQNYIRWNTEKRGSITIKSYYKFNSEVRGIREVKYIVMIIKK